MTPVQHQIISLINIMKDVDFKKLPSFYFYSALRTQLKKQGKPGFSDYWESLIFNSLEVDLTWLGRDFEGHEEFLDSFAEGIAALIYKIIEDFEDFGPDVVRNHIRQLKFSVS